MIDVTCPHCGFIYQIDPPKPKKTSPKKTAEMEAYLQTWNAFAKEQGLPEVRDNNTTVQAKLFTRMKEQGFAEDFKDSLEHIKANSFFRGINDTHWKATLEYLLRPGKAEELASKQRAENTRGPRSQPTPGNQRLLSRTRGDEDLSAGAPVR